MPSTCWKNSVVGIAKPITVAPIIAIATFATEKLRSRNSDSGTSGSRRITACQRTNTASTSTPARIIPGTVTGTPVSTGPITRESVILPQS